MLLQLQAGVAAVRPGHFFVMREWQGRGLSRLWCLCAAGALVAFHSRARCAVLCRERTTFADAGVGDARLVHDGADILQARAVTSCLMWDVFACGWNGANVRVKTYEEDLEWGLTLVLYLVLTPGDGPGNW